MSTKRYLFYISQNYSFAILRPLQSAIIARGDQAAWFLEGNEVNVEYLQPDELLLPSISQVQVYQVRQSF